MISVITPTFNARDYIENAINNVLDQEYPDFEHIVVDGASTDGTVEILKKYPHLKWVSEPDSGQPEAMNKGFNMSTGDIIVYLNGDDFFLPGAFKAVAPYFECGAMFVAGKVYISRDVGDNYTHDPNVEFIEMLRHWELNAFPYNPVGYFYRREVQEAVGNFNEANDDKQDHEFLLAAVKKFKIEKIDRVLGVYRDYEDTKTQINQKKADYWTFENFAFIDKYLAEFPPEFVEKFNADRLIGYRKMANYQAWKKQKLYEAVKRISVRAWIHDLKKGLQALPVKWKDGTLFPKREKLLDPKRPNILIYQMGSVGSNTVYYTLKKYLSGLPIHHVHQLSREGLKRKELLFDRQAVRKRNDLDYYARLSSAVAEYKNDLQWRIITLVRDPVVSQIRGYFENLQRVFPEYLDDEGNVRQTEVMDFLELNFHKFDIDRNYYCTWFDEEPRQVFGINVYDHPYDHQRGYTIIKKDNLRLLVIRTEDLNGHLGSALEEFLDLDEVRVVNKNVGIQKYFSQAYAYAKQNLVIPEQVLDVVYNSPHVQHFYTPEDIARFRDQWSRKTH